MALAIGIFRPRKQMPVDMFQVGSGVRGEGRGGWLLLGLPGAVGHHTRAVPLLLVLVLPGSLLRSLPKPTPIQHRARTLPNNTTHEQAMEFAQSKGNARRDGSTGVTFADVGGLGNTISEMMQVVEVRPCSFLVLSSPLPVSPVALARREL